ncbi:5' nucleotidase, NT5C type [Rhodococcus kronopolitis]|uniref:Uncharacterized protein n=1 Tax=Rhodococcus kronopolitis TaxID=1460226 RepID=A0ABV9FUU4_9NOCA
MPDSTKQVLYVDLDNTLVDFKSGIGRAHPELLARHDGDLDEIPGIFATMDPLPGAIEAYTELAAHFDTYILSTAPWANASAWHDKVLWVQRHFGFGKDSVAYKRLILSHHKNLNHGDFLVDDRPNNGASGFAGNWIHFGFDESPGCTAPGAGCHGTHLPDWAAVTKHLLDRS